MSSAGPMTLRVLTAPSVLAISCSPDLSARCAQAVQTLGIALRECGFVGAATAVAEHRPLVMVLMDDVYAFDPDEFDALARDVGASLVRVEEHIPVAKLEMLLWVALDAAAQRRRLSADPPPPSSRRDESPRSSRDPARLHVGRRVPTPVNLTRAAWSDRASMPPPSSQGTGGV